MPLMPVTWCREAARPARSGSTRSSSRCAWWSDRGIACRRWSRRLPSIRRCRTGGRSGPGGAHAPVGGGGGGRHRPSGGGGFPGRLGFGSSRRRRVRQHERASRSGGDSRRLVEVERWRVGVPGHSGSSRRRALPDEVCASPRAGRGPPASHGRGDGFPRPDQRPHRAGHSAADSHLRCAGRTGNAGSSRGPVACDGVPFGPLRGCDARTSDVGGVRPGSATVGDDRLHHGSLPNRHHEYPADCLCVIGGPRTGSDAVGRAGRGHGRTETRGRRSRSEHRSRRTALGPGGILALAPRGCRVPRRCRRCRHFREAERACRCQRRHSATGNPPTGRSVVGFRPDRLL